MCKPSGRTVRSPASPSIVVSRSPSSAETTRVSPVGFPLSLSITGASSGAISRSKRPSSTAILALRCDSNPHASRSSRVSPRLCAIRSAASNWLGMSIVHDSGRGSPAPGGTLAPSGIRLIDSTPQAIPDLDRPGLDHVVDQVGGLLSRTALRVHGRRAGGLGEPGVQPGASDHVVGLLAGLGDDAADDLLDELGVDAGTLEHLALDEPEQLARVHAGEAATALAERGADSVDDHGVSHGTKLEHVLIFGNATPIFWVPTLPKQTESM